MLLSLISINKAIPQFENIFIFWHLVFAAHLNLYIKYSINIYMHNIYIYTHIYTHTHTYIYIYICLFVYKLNIANMVWKTLNRHGLARPPVVDPDDSLMTKLLIILKIIWYFCLNQPSGACTIAFIQLSRFFCFLTERGKNPHVVRVDHRYDRAENLNLKSTISSKLRGFWSRRAGAR